MARIIIADDDEIAGSIARDALADAGHVVGLVGDGRDALAAIRAKSPDLVVLDCNMPELSGLLVLRAMRDDKAMWNIPVLMLTGRQSDRDVELARYEGAGDYMKKPFDPDELVFRVEELLKARAKR